MNRINVLSEALANRIAAGEVVDRPASVVKELVENAIDAEATRIEVELAEGGRKLIRVSDDGLGMSPEDAALCVQRFATSKVSEEADLQHIETMGFRGEALPSIASVSHLRITTRLRESDEGTMLTIEGGEIAEVRAVGCPTGTTIEVANLFFNTPARLKFLRTTGTERGHCSDWVTRMALARPDIAMQMTHEGTVLISSPGRGDLPATVAQILGSTVARQMLPVDLDTGAMRIHGLISSSRLTRATRKHQMFFVNRRYVRSMSLGHALREAYGILLPSGKQPLCALHIDMPAQLVDPNVHPTKIEVRFKSQGEVHGLMQQAVEEGLEQAGLRPKSMRTPPRGPDQAGRFTGPDLEQRTMARRLRVNPFYDATDERDVGLEVHEGEPEPDATATEDPAIAVGEALEALGQVAGAYIACRSGGDLLLVDQHRAAERIIADELASKDHAVARQMLMLPMTLELTDAEQAAVDEHREALGEAGFEIEPFGGSGYLVRSVPASLAERAPEEALRGIIEELAEWGKSDQGDARERLIATIACHGAIKSGEHLSEREMRHLIGQLNRSSTPAICPHGDPIIVSISRAELDRRFGRSYRDN
jgi:DNA mismatch repair protein MutL